MDNSWDGIEKAVQQSFRLSALVLKPLGAVWKVQSAAGCFILKPVKQEPEQIRRLDSDLSNIRSAGFEGTPELFKQRNGEPFMEHSGRCFILMPWYPGENPSFQNPKHVQRIAALYGLFHRASLKISRVETNLLQYWIAEYGRRIDFIENTLERLRKFHPSEPFNRIDRAILTWGEYFLRQARFCLAGLLAHSHENSMIPAGFCHKDPAPRNIIIQSPDWILIDFDLGGADLYIKEIAVLILRLLEANQWRTDSVQNVLSVYETKRPVSEDEKKLLPYFLGFPQGYWRLCNQRYVEKLRRKEHYFQEKLWRLLDREDCRINALTSWCPELSEFANFRENTAKGIHRLLDKPPEHYGGITCPK